MSAALRICLCLFLCAGGTRAETYREWLSAAPARPEIAFVPWSDDARASTQRINSSVRNAEGNELYWQIPTAPREGCLGTLDIRNAPAGSRIDILFSDVATADLLPPGQQLPVLHWGKPMELLDFSSSIRKTRNRASYILAGGNTRIPVMPPWRSPTRAAFTDFAWPIVNLRVAWSDADGKPLARMVPLETVGTHNSHDNPMESAWVFGAEAEADKLLRERMRSPHIVGRGTEWPTSDAVLLNASVLWFPEEMLGSVPVPALRRTLLMGSWIHGRAETMRRLREAVGGSAGSAEAAESRGLGGIAPLDTRGSPATALSSTSRSRRDLSRPGSDPDKSSLCLFKKPEDMLVAMRPFLKGSTVFVLGGYLLVCAVVLPLGFWRLRGESRLKLWWISPGLAAVFALAAWVANALFLDPAPRADWNEIRVMHAGWPEAYIQTVTRWMTARPGPEIWNLPPGSFEIQATPQDSVRYTDYSEMLHDERGTRFMALGANRGSIISRQFGSFVTAEPPVAREGDRLVSRIAAEEVFVWRRGELFTLGTMQPGESKPVETRVPAMQNKHTHETEHLGFAATWITGMLSPRNERDDRDFAKYPVTDDELAARLKDLPIAAWGHDWVAIVRGGDPIISPGDAVRASTKTVYWIVQIPAAAGGGL